eukprot:6207758-Pleurochrysis_carterae.AAC.3
MPQGCVAQSSISPLPTASMVALHMFITVQCALLLHAQSLVESRGHILVMSPKGHCELAGQGIEYDWGKQKYSFQRRNTYNLTMFHQLILECMSSKLLPLITSRKFSRKARAYRRAYAEDVDNASMHPSKGWFNSSRRIDAQQTLPANSSKTPDIQASLRASGTASFIFVRT